MRMRYELQTEVPNTYVRKELRKNMTNLPYRWVGVALSDDLDALKTHMTGRMRIEDRNTGEIFSC